MYLQSFAVFAFVADFLSDTPGLNHQTKSGTVKIQGVHEKTGGADKLICPKAMKGINIQLTYVDRIILQSYCHMLDGLSNYMGSGYEIVLHSLEDCSHSAIKVINGEHTGRKKGAPITDLALTMLDRIQKRENDHLEITYFTKNKKGEPLKSTTIAIKGENERIIGLLCINFYLNTPLFEVLGTFVEENLTEIRQEGNFETFSANNQEMIEDLVKRVWQEVMNDTTISLSKKNKEIIQRLYKKGIYNMKDAVLKTAQILNMSKNTVYLHLRNLESDH